MKKKDTIPCCAAEAMRRIRHLDVGGVSVGLSMIDTVFAETRGEGITDERQLREALVSRAKIYNYIPDGAAAAYADALLADYQREMMNHGND